MQTRQATFFIFSDLIHEASPGIGWNTDFRSIANKSRAQGKATPSVAARGPGLPMPRVKIMIPARETEPAPVVQPGGFTVEGWEGLTFAKAEESVPFDDFDNGRRDHGFPGGVVGLDPGEHVAGEDGKIIHLVVLK